jgi:1,2-phenylacetyl-CoA epoxidase catalytic subunit
MKMEIKKSEKIKRSEMSKWNINKLMDEGVKEEFIKELTINLRNMTPGKQGNRNKIKKAINEAAEKITGKEGRPLRDSWFNEECQMAIESKNRVYKRC